MRQRWNPRMVFRFPRNVPVQLLAVFLFSALTVHAQNSVERGNFLPRHHHVFASSIFSGLSNSVITTDISAVPIAGGDVLGPPDFPAVLIHQFLPGTDPGFDGLNAELNGITNFRGLAALAYTQGAAIDNFGLTHIAQTDIRVYQGEYVTAEGVHKRGTFVEIWIDFFDPSSGSAEHDFNPGTLPDGMFWMVQVPDEALKIEGNTITLSLENVPETDVFTFYDPFPPSGNVPSVVSFVMSYTRSSSPRQVRPASNDPTSPFNWAGEMWAAAGSVTFSVAHTDGSFSARGSASSQGAFGEMGTERNGFFVSGR